MKNFAFLAVFFVSIIKLPFLLTHHIQEDAYITWRVAQNILDYGVIGFNGEERISSSTTHLYTFLSLIFNWLLGKSNFIAPLLVFNMLLFAFGSYFLAKIFFSNQTKQALFIVLLNLIPPALKSSYLGMEYALVFFLMCGFLFYAIWQNKKWAMVVFPILLLWTRLDTAVFLGIVFLSYTFFNRNWNWFFVISGIIGFGSVLVFNYLYFGDLINHTIKAKSIAYQELNPPFSHRLQRILFYISLIKNNTWLIVAPSFALLAASLWMFSKSKFKQINLKTIAYGMLCFALVKWLLFSVMQANFDWYYWNPQIFLFALVLIGFLNLFDKKKYVLGFALIVMAPLVAYSAIHSIATGNGEWNHRAKIGKYFNQIEPDKSQYIMLEPAGYIPYYSGLKTIDDVGLVHKGVTMQMEKDFNNWWYNTVQEYKPKHILTIQKVPKFISAKQYNQFKQEYDFVKTFKINDALDSDYLILRKIYQLKPSGRDYHYYKKKD